MKNEQLKFKASPSRMVYIPESVIALGILFLIIYGCPLWLGVLFLLLFAIYFIPWNFNHHTVTIHHLLIWNGLSRLSLKIKNIRTVTKTDAKEVNFFAPQLTLAPLMIMWTGINKDRLFMTNSHKNLLLLTLRKPVKYLGRNIHQVVINVDDTKNFIEHMRKMMIK
jgi:hypothetical protein